MGPQFTSLGAFLANLSPSDLYMAKLMHAAQPMQGNGMSPQGSAPPMGPGMPQQMALGMGAPPPYGPGRQDQGPPMTGAPPTGPGRFPVGAPPPTGPYDGDQPELADRASGNQGALSGALQAGDDAPDAPVPVAKPKRPKGKKAPAATPAANYNERSAYDGAATEPPTPSQADMDAAVKVGTPSPEDMAAATKVHPQEGTTGTQATQGSPQGPGILSKIGGALSSAFHNQDLGDLLSGVSTGLLLGKNVKEGTGIGLQLADARINRRREMEQQQSEFDARMGLQNRGLDIEQRGQDQRGEQFGQELGYKNRALDTETGLTRDQMAQKADQFQQNYGLQKDDLSLRRDENALMSRYRAQQLALSERELGERQSQDRFGNSLNLAQLKEQMRQHDQQFNSPESVQLLPDQDGQGTVAVKKMHNGSIQTEPVPGVSAGLQLASQNNKADLVAEQGMAAKATNALNVLDDTNRVDQILAKNPGGIGPDVISGTQRWLATTLGLPGQDPVAELRNLKASQQLDLAASKLKGQGAVSDRERALIAQAASNIDTMSPAMLKELNEVRRKQATADMGVYDDFLSKNADKAKGAVAFDYVNRRGRALSQGGARSGEPPVSSGGRAVSVGGKSINYTVE